MLNKVREQSIKYTSSDWYMEELVKTISRKSKNFYGSDIDIKDFIDAIPMNELRCIKDKIKNHMDIFFSKDKGEILGYYVCKGHDPFKFYMIAVNNTLYMALEAVPPLMWYKTESYSDFKKVVRAYNKNSSKFTNRITRISAGLSENAVVGDIMKNIKSDYEYMTFIYNICLSNPFMNMDVFGYDELYDEYLNSREYNSMERALLTKCIFDKENGFCIRTLYTNSIVSVKCVKGVMYMSFFFNECPLLEGIGNIPLDMYIFMLNFNLASFDQLLSKNSMNIVQSICASIQKDYYGEFRFSIYNYLLSLKDSDKVDPVYVFALRKLFTNFTMKRILDEMDSDTMSSMKNSNKLIIEYIKDKFTNEEKSHVVWSIIEELELFKNSASSQHSNTKISEGVEESGDIEESDE